MVEAQGNDDVARELVQLLRRQIWMLAVTEALELGARFESAGRKRGRPWRSVFATAAGITGAFAGAEVVGVGVRCLAHRRMKFAAGDLLRSMDFRWLRTKHKGLQLFGVEKPPGLADFTWFVDRGCFPKCLLCREKLVLRQQNFRQVQVLRAPADPQ
jgi:hypothetical protein